MKTATVNFLNENENTYSTRIGEISKSDVIEINEHNQLVVDYDLFEGLYNEKNPPVKKIMTWEGEEMKYGILPEVLDILGYIVKTVPGHMLDGMGTGEAQDLKEERNHLRSIGAIKF